MSHFFLKNVLSTQFFVFSLQIIIDEPEEDNTQEFREENIHIDPDYLSSARDSEIPSRLSFIVKEKLHEFAKDLRRRTSQVKEDVIRDLTPEATEVINFGFWYSIFCF